MSSTTTNSSSGIGFSGLLTIVFIVLKLTNYIDWSWWWALSPIWIPLFLVIFIYSLIALKILFIYLISKK